MAVKCYIVDDMISIVKVLGRIIEEKDLCSVVGVATDPKLAEREIKLYEPDLVLVDLLMPDMDGITLVKNIKKVKPNINFIMISQVSNSDMVAEAYNEGIEFFIRKPINVIEVESIMKKIIDKINMEKMLGGIRQMVQNEDGNSDIMTLHNEERQKEIKYILGLIGILGERGGKDILAVCEYMIENSDLDCKDAIIRYSEDSDEDEKMVRQRIRRACKKGLTNVANLAIEDYYNEIVQTYGQMIYDFEAIRSEMDYIREKSQVSGKIAINGVIDGLIALSEVK